MAKLYEVAHGSPPALEDQVNDNGLGKQLKECSAGRVGFFTTSDLVPFVPDEYLTAVKQVMQVSRSGDTQSIWYN